jgi:hypothetical protein
VALMPFGKFKGTPLESLPDDYLGWLTTIELKEPLLSAVAEERERRAAATPRHPPHLDAVREVAKEIVGVGYRELARRSHPDAGGSHQKMVVVNAARNLLQERLSG